MTSAWTGFLDDDGPVPDPATVPGHPSPYVGRRVVHVDDLDRVAPHVGDRPLLVPFTGAAELSRVVRLRGGGVPVAAVRARLADPADPVANVRRVLLAAETAELPDNVLLHVQVDGPPLGSWLAVADDVASAEGALHLDLGSPDLEAWIDAALDRELPFTVHGGTLDDAIAALTTTARLWGDADDLLAARRWCRAWTCLDVVPAVAHLEGLT